MKDSGLLFERANIINRVREFFRAKNYLELDTPLLSPDLIPESCLEVFKTNFYNSGTAAKELYLVPSPEIWMKKFISEKREDVFQICKCFRNCESIGQIHSPEFTMLEYYTMNFNYLDSISLTEELLDFLLADNGVTKNGPANEGLLNFQGRDKLKSIAPPFERLTMEEAFIHYAGFSLEDSIRRGTLAVEAKRLGIAPDGAEDGVLYNLIFIHCVECSLPQDRPVVLLDYPAIVPCLSKEKAPFSKERWELYIHGLEIANCYSEETDARKVKEYFEGESALKKALCRVQHKIDKDYWKYFLDFPKCSGVALGLDRLIMCLLDKKTIDGVLPFDTSLFCP